mmetsp:Transcript_9737/g.28255  ORF Transcript_9737/g.28255 Transcript_9737/m.28255 type:complete len:219 (-) Transcript_9737:458-1114(-)
MSTAAQKWPARLSRLSKPRSSTTPNAGTAAKGSPRQLPAPRTKRHMRGRCTTCSRSNPCCGRRRLPPPPPALVWGSVRPWATATLSVPAATARGTSRRGLALLCPRNSGTPPRNPAPRPHRRHTSRKRSRTSRARSTPSCSSGRSSSHSPSPGRNCSRSTSATARCRRRTAGRSGSGSASSVSRPSAASTIAPGTPRAPVGNPPARRQGRSRTEAGRA